ncbi:MAG: RsmE family RNA methyltransferase [Actinomycetes bacterium]
MAERQAASTQVFVEDLDAPALGEADRHHLTRVLRLRSGESVVAADGRGGWRLCRYADGALAPHGEIHHEDRPEPALTVAFAPTKGDRPEWTVQKLAELGIDTISPLHSARSVVRWEGDRGTRQVARLQEVAVQAARQSRRLWRPVVTPVTTFADLVAARPGDLVLSVAGGAPPSLGRPVVLVGPEGGWGPDELRAGLPIMGLGSGVLRAETASVTAAAVLTALRAGLVRPV